MDFMNHTYPTLTRKEQAELVRDLFYADYAGKPFYDVASPVPRGPPPETATRD